MATWNTLQHFNELIISEFKTFKWIYLKTDLGKQPKCPLKEEEEEEWENRS